MCGGYPLGAEYDSRAPWNEVTEDYDVTVETYNEETEVVETHELTVTIYVNEWIDDNFYKICEEVRNTFEDFEIVEYKRA